MTLLPGSGIQISQDQFNALREAVSNGDYTKYHYLKSMYGSSLSTLYVPGPTGQGFFGSLSHNYTAEFIGSSEFENKQTTISQKIAQTEISFITSSFDGKNYYLPNISQTIALEIRSWASAELPIESYAGNILDSFIGSNAPGTSSIDLSKLAKLFLALTGGLRPTPRNCSLSLKFKGLRFWNCQKSCRSFPKRPVVGKVNGLWPRKSRVPGRSNGRGRVCPTIVLGKVEAPSAKTISQRISSNEPATL